MQKVLFYLGTYPDEDDEMKDIIVDAEELFGARHENLIAFLDEKFDLIRVLIGDHIKYSRAAKIIEQEENDEILYDVLRDLHPYFTFHDGLISHYLNRLLSGVMHARYSNVETLLKELERNLFRKGLSGLNTKWYYDNPIDKEPSPESLLGIQERLKVWILMAKDMKAAVFSKYPDKVRENAFAALMSGAPEKGCCDLSEVKIRSGVCDSPELKKAIGIFNKDFEKISGAVRGLLKGKSQSFYLETILRDMQDDWLNGECIMYDIAGFPELFDVEMHIISQNGLRFNHCKNCGKLYVYDKDRTDSEYCYGKECGKIAFREESMVQAREIYHKAYKAHFQRKARGKMTDEELKAWMEKFSAMKEGILTGNVKLEDYIDEIVK